MIACYCRGSFVEQNLDRRLRPTGEYTRKRLGGEPAEVEVYRDESAGTNTTRSGSGGLMERSTLASYRRSSRIA